MLAHDDVKSQNSIAVLIVRGFGTLLSYAQLHNLRDTRSNAFTMTVKGKFIKLCETRVVLSQLLESASASSTLRSA